MGTMQVGNQTVNIPDPSPMPNSEGAGGLSGQLPGGPNYGTPAQAGSSGGGYDPKLKSWMDDTFSKATGGQRAPRSDEYDAWIGPKGYINQWQGDPAHGMDYATHRLTLHAQGDYNGDNPAYDAEVGANKAPAGTAGQDGSSLLDSYGTSSLFKTLTDALPNQQRSTIQIPQLPSSGGGAIGGLMSQPAPSFGGGGAMGGLMQRGIAPNLPQAVRQSALARLMGGG